MTHINKRLYKPLTNDINREDTGIYWDETNSRIVAGQDGTIYEVPALIASQARGDIIRRGASTWERVAAGELGAQLIGDGTDITVGGAYLHSQALYRQQNRCSINFQRQNAVNIHAKNTMAIATAVNAQQDFFYVNGHYFELAQGVGATGANTLLAANGLTPAAGGWLLTCDNTATDSIEITRGIVLGSACNAYVVGTDSFYLKVIFHSVTRASVTHFKIGFRNLAAYETANTQVEALAAYDDKVWLGYNNNGGRIGRCTSLATVDAELNAAHAAIADGSVVALEVSINAAGLAVCRIGHATPAGATYAEMLAAAVAANANLAVDATIEGTAFTCTNGVVMIPSIILGASGAAAPDFPLMFFECSYNE